MKDQIPVCFNQSFWIIHSAFLEIIVIIELIILQFPGKYLQKSWLTKQKSADESTSSRR